MTTMSHTNAMRFVADECGLLARRLPFSVVEALAEALAAADPADWASGRAKALENLAHAHYRGLVVAFFDVWRARAADVSPQAVALALLTAATAEKANREHQSVELVWTGPDMGVVPVRRTWSLAC